MAPDAVRLRAGDVVLVQGARSALDAAKNDVKLLVADGTIELPRSHRAKRTLLVLFLVVGAAATGLLPISVSALIGVSVLIALGCISWANVGRSLPVAVIMLIVASLAMGKALVVTGMAEFLALGLVRAAGGLPIPIILSGFILIMTASVGVLQQLGAVDVDGA